MYYSVYDECSKRLYDTVDQLMKLAEKNNSGGFFDLAEASKDLFYGEYSLFETAVAAGLMVRNKAEILDDFLTAVDNRHFRNTEILSHLAGLLIRERRCGEAVKALIVRMSDKLMQKSYILFSAAMADNLEIFRLLYTESYYSFGNSLLLCGLFKSKKVLDHITDCGRLFISGNMPCEVNLISLIRGNHDLSSEGAAFNEKVEKDISVKWLNNIYSMYFAKEEPEKAYESIMNIAKKMGLIFDKDRDLSFYQMYYNMDINFSRIVPFQRYHNRETKNMVMREIYIMLMFGQKTNDLTYFILYDQPIDQTDAEYIDILMKIADDEPFITYGDWIKKSEYIDRLPEGLKNKLTVRLVRGFDLSDIELLRDTVRLEIDAENKITAHYLSTLLTPSGGSDKEKQENQRRFVRYLIDNGFCTVEKMTDIAYSVKNFDIIKLLYNYANERNETDKKTKGA